MNNAERARRTINTWPPYKRMSIIRDGRVVPWLQEEIEAMENDDRLPNSWAECVSARDRLLYSAYVSAMPAPGYSIERIEADLREVVRDWLRTEEAQEHLTSVLESLWRSEAAITFGGAVNTIKTDEQMAAVLLSMLAERIEEGTRNG